jgi:uncharacterized protein YfkK (UPF0435 family)
MAKAMQNTAFVMEAIKKLKLLNGTVNNPDDWMEVLWKFWYRRFCG